MSKQNGTTTRKKRTRLFFEQKGLCFYCSRPMLLAKIPEGMRQPPHLATLDHIVPHSAGGTIANNNTVAACAACNVERGNRDARLFMLKKQGALA